MQLQTIKRKISKEIDKKIKNNKFVSLDVGCGAYKRVGALGMDIRPLEGVDIVHDFNQFPWPIPDEVCMLVTATHVVEHIPKWGASPQIHALAKLMVKKGLLTQKEIDQYVGETQIFSYWMRFLDEVWRISKVGGQFAMVLPYAGSAGFYQDPTHAAPVSEATFFYFDPEHSSNLWHIYKPMPWKIEINSYQVNGNIEVVLSKRELKEEYKEAKYV
jgi:hypothetical protein